MKKKQKARGLIPGRHDYNPPARTAESDRRLLNWLSTRVTPDGLECGPDSEYERALVENRLAYAKALGLQPTFRTDAWCTFWIIAYIRETRPLLRMSIINADGSRRW